MTLHIVLERKRLTKRAQISNYNLLMVSIFIIAFSISD